MENPYKNYYDSLEKGQTFVVPVDVNFLIATGASISAAISFKDALFDKTASSKLRSATGTLGLALVAIGVCNVKDYLTNTYVPYKETKNTIKKLSYDEE